MYLQSFVAIDDTKVKIETTRASVTAARPKSVMNNVKNRVIKCLNVHTVIRLNTCWDKVIS